LAEALWVQALAALRQGDVHTAEHALAEGLTLARAMPYPHGEARLLHVNGLLHIQQGGPDPARQRLAAALAIFRRLGARRDAVHVEQAVAALQPRAAAVPVSPSLPALPTGVPIPSGARPARAVRQAWALECLRTAGPLSPGAYAVALGVSVDTALRDLQQLVDQGLVQAAGRTKNRRYSLAGATGALAIHRSGL
jgi:hypothetical protein